MPSSSRSPQSRKSSRRCQRARPLRKAASESSSTDSSDLTSISDTESDLPSPTSCNSYQPDELDEPITYMFQNGDAVWIKTEDGEWTQGTISGSNTRKGATRQKEGLFFPVAFNHNSRRYFAPLNGDIKPDNAEVRRLLSEGGWL
ncbi:hypothetical protein WOLCODRAFT_134896 [Wolfiporia cocos MD-104 SS10]|uniref:Uncharacterized protein n=1 Tax=Wolfiporia cocos (strain MD-104) TaxID=742152 RepID=A0A2H3JAX9_WOLCO|nr:hypothetical protein WOLCODRAFT_134896 [Wolfiporia cocos MD-104 SS10]